MQRNQTEDNADSSICRAVGDRDPNERGRQQTTRARVYRLVGDPEEVAEPPSLINGLGGVKPSSTELRRARSKPEKATRYQLVLFLLVLFVTARNNLLYDFRIPLLL